MMKWEGPVSVALISFLLVMAFIGWAKYFDERQESELWYVRYSDEVDELRKVKTNRDDIEFMRQACVHDRDYYKSALEKVSCVDDLNALLDKYHEVRWERDKLQRKYETQCGWDMCNCAFGELGWVGPDRELCDDLGITPFYVAQALCVYDWNCSACLEMTDGNVDHCFRYAYYP